MKKIDTFSANSLKVLDRSLEEFKQKYLFNLSLLKKDNRAILGQKFHSLICYFINGFDVSKMVLELNEKEIKIWQNLENILKDKKQNFIHTEFPFLIKEKLNDKNYYLTGRYDAIYKENENYIIYDWKTLNLPTVAILYFLSVICAFPERAVTVTSGEIFLKSLTILLRRASSPLLPRP